jgi:hypothetical protein
MTDGSETIALRKTLIGGQTYPDDYTVIWRELPIGRIMRAPGLPPHVPQWRWTCNLSGKPGGGGGGAGNDLEDCKRQFKAARATLRARLTESDIASAHEYAENSKEALARYDRKRGT